MREISPNFLESLRVDLRENNQTELKDEFEKKLYAKHMRFNTHFVDEMRALNAVYDKKYKTHAIELDKKKELDAINEIWNSDLIRVRITAKAFMTDIKRKPQFCGYTLISANDVMIERGRWQIEVCATIELYMPCRVLEKYRNQHERYWLISVL